MTLKQTIADDMKSAMREKDKIKLETIRLLMAAIQRKEIDDKIKTDIGLDDDGVLSIVRKMVKQCTDASKQFVDGGRDDLAAREQSNIEILQHYLPAQLSEQEIQQIIQKAVKQTGATGMQDMGKVMGVVKSATQGRADMGIVSAQIKSLLS